MLYDCLIKTQHSAKIKYQSIECDICPNVGWITNLPRFLAQVLKDTPMNGGLISEGPKVAKYLGR